MEKTCLFCGSDLFDSNHNCMLCHRSRINGDIVGDQVDGVVRRTLTSLPNRLPLVLSLVSSILTIIMSVLLFVSHFTEKLLFVYLPDLDNSVWLAFLMLLIGGGMMTYGIYRFVLGRRAKNAAYVLNGGNDEQSKGLAWEINYYYTYEGFTKNFFMLLLAIPLVMYPMIFAFVYYASTYDYMTVLDLVRVILPDMEKCFAFKLTYLL